jgi:hypothetical protein
LSGESAAAATVTTLNLTSIGGNWTNASNTIADLGSVTTCDINGGAIDGAVIGAASQVAGDFSAIGAVAAGTIVGTTIDATTDFTIDGLVLTADTITNDAGLSIVASSGDITLNPAGNNVLPGGDSEDDLGVSGTAWRALYVDSIEMNGQGAIAGATHITASGNISISGDIFSSGNLDIDGTANIAGNITLQSDLSVVDINASGNITGSSVSASSGDFSTTNIDGGTVDGITSLTVPPSILIVEKSPLEALTDEPVILPLALISTTDKSDCKVIFPAIFAVPSISKLPELNISPLILIFPLAVICVAPAIAP